MDMYLEYGQDLLIDGNGDIATATGWDETRQRIQRLLLTTCQETFLDGTSTQPEYLWDVNYGLGFRALEAEEFNEQTLATMKQKIAESVLTTPGVNPNVPPIVTVTSPAWNEILATIVVTLADNTQVQFTVSLP